MREAIVIGLSIIGFVALIGALAFGVAEILTAISKGHEDIG